MIHPEVYRPDVPLDELPEGDDWGVRSIMLDIEMSVAETLDPGGADETEWEI